MKVFSVLAALAIGIFLGAFLKTDLSYENPNGSCDYMEQTRLEIAMKECSDVVMYYVWDHQIPLTERSKSNDL